MWRKQRGLRSCNRLLVPRPRAKETRKQTDDGSPVHSFRTMLADLGTLAKNRVRLVGVSGSEFYKLTQPTALQQRALDLLGVTP